MAEYNHADYRPYVLWLETLPSGEEGMGQVWQATAVSTCVAA